MFKEMLRLAGAGVLVATLGGCRVFEPTPKPTFHPEVLDPRITTECRGDLLLSRIRGELRSIGKRDAVIEPVISEKPPSKEDIEYIKANFDRATCNIPNINRPDLATNTVVLCGRELTLPMLKRELIAAGYPERGPWDGKSTIKAFRDAGCPEENILSATPTPTSQRKV